jgi:DNA processing protein
MRYGHLVNFFGSAKSAYLASEADLLNINLGSILTRKFIEFRNGFDIDDYAGNLKRQHIGILIRSDPQYPGYLKNISDAPIILYVKGVKGDKPVNLERTVAVVGTRKITDYGREVTREFVRGLVSAGITVISGMAYGVDAVAHETALDSGGQTVAVLGCGVDVIAPPSNTNLYHRIINSKMGAVVSEMPLGLRPNKGLFPARNRIISGMSLGVIVIEGTDDSGSLITARYAAQQGREVFGVPGPINSQYSLGPAKLIRDGAELVTSAREVIESLGLGTGKLINTKTAAFDQSGLSETGRKIVVFLDNGPVQIDLISRGLNLTIAEVAATLTILEMEGIVKDLGDKVYSLV